MHTHMYTLTLMNTHSHTHILVLNPSAMQTREGREDWELVVDWPTRDYLFCHFFWWETYSLNCVRTFTYLEAELKPDPCIQTPSSVLFFSATSHSNLIHTKCKNGRQINARICFFLQFEVNTSNGARNFTIRKSALVVKAGPVICKYW